MTIKYYPNDLLKKIAPVAKIEKLVSGKLTLNKTALSFVEDIDFISKDAIKKTALKTIKQYKERFKAEREDGSTVSEALDDTLAGKTLLVQRVQNTVVKQVSDEIKDSYYGEFYTWLPSDANEPDPQHQLKYGMKFQIGKGEMPGERYGCRCGMKILVMETKLEL
jgi:ribosomal protein S17E